MSLETLNAKARKRYKTRTDKERDYSSSERCWTRKGFMEKDRTVIANRKSTQMKVILQSMVPIR